MRFISLSLCTINLSNKTRSTATWCSSKNCKRLIGSSGTKLQLNIPPPPHTTTFPTAENLSAKTQYILTPGICAFTAYGNYMQNIHMEILQISHFFISIFKGGTANTGRHSEVASPAFLDMGSPAQQSLPFCLAFICFFLSVRIT